MKSNEQEENPSNKQDENSSNQQVENSSNQQEEISERSLLGSSTEQTETKAKLQKKTR